MKIVLCSAFVNNDYTFSKYYHKLPTLGIGYIAAVLEKEGYGDVSIIDMTLHTEESPGLVRDILDKKPDVVGFYAVSENYKFVVSLFEKIKEARPEIKTVLGGPHVYGLPKESLSSPAIDFAINGEAEYSFLELVKSGFSPESYKDIRGLIYRSGSGGVTANPMVLVEDLDSLPFPARHLYPPMDKYMPSIITYRKLPATGMLTSRGCSSRCTFCHSGKGEFGLRFHSPEYVIEEIKHLQKDYGIKEFFVFDDTFVANRERAAKICELIIKEKLNISWSCNVKVNYLSEDLLVLMRRSGCWLLQIGVESGNQEVLNIMKKGITLKMVTDACTSAYKLGFHIKTFWIIGNAGETVETIDDTIRFMGTLPSHYASINLMTPLPGTELWDKVDRFGSFDKEKLEEINYLSDKPSFIPKDLDEATLLRKFREAYLKFYLNPRTVMRNLLVLRNFQDMKRFVKASFLLSRLLYNKITAGIRETPNGSKQKA